MIRLFVPFLVFLWAHFFLLYVVLHLTITVQTKENYELEKQTRGLRPEDLTWSLYWQYSLNTIETHKRNNLKQISVLALAPTIVLAQSKSSWPGHWPRNSFHASSLSLKSRDRKGRSDNCAPESAVNKTYFFTRKGGLRGRQAKMLTHRYSHTHILDTHAHINNISETCIHNILGIIMQIFCAFPNALI